MKTSTMISFKTYGDLNGKQVLVLIHGLATDGEIFEDFITEKFISKFNVVIPDIRGCGQSAMLDGEFTIHEAATDIISVLNKLSKNKVVILGYSQGGTVAQEIARLRPDIVSGPTGNVVANRVSRSLD
jgi:pimeloyl-ACP methyl ester carboxylesterase